MTTAKVRPAILRRYTSLPSLFHILCNQQITLLSPSTWDDRNDAYFMAQYKKRKRLKTLVALCFAAADETYHHWRVFTRGAEGVCLSFRQTELLAHFGSISGIRVGPVKYLKINDIRRSRPRVEELPFLKRQPYFDEREFRIVFGDKRVEVEFKSLDIALGCIERVTLSPWLPKALAAIVKSRILAIAGCSEVKVYQTSLLENEKWKDAALAARS